MVMLIKLLQPSNALLPIEVTLSGIVTCVKFLQYSNAESPIRRVPFIISQETNALSTASTKKISAYRRFPITGKLSQYSNAPAPMSITLLGIITLFKRLHSENASSPIVVTLSGMVILVKFSHTAKASLSIVVTLLGMDILVKLLQ